MTTNHSRLEFEKKLAEILNKIKEKAENQYKYNIETNVPREIVKIEDCAENAVNHGLISAFNTVNGWDTYAATKFAHGVLEDCNAHTEARALIQFLPECQIHFDD